MKRMKTNKASGPDGVRPSVSKTLCRAIIFRHLLSILMSLNIQNKKYGKHHVLFQCPKNHPLNNMNDLCPVARVSCVMGVFEKYIMPDINKIVGNFFDPYQYAYKEKRFVDDAILHVLNNICALRQIWGSIRLKFYDFFSAFSTIQPN